ncbi:MAG: hypothetical protein A2V98_25435 [Planctomycetes bacterium RBG_16_64_12]|nr:MAG: hypothetical protein A2V98_25435 [Planctomycetes bacterium RBG_16_64_12]
MPSLAELPEELQEELRREEAKRQEKEKQKYLRKQERYLKEIEKQEKGEAKQKSLEEKKELAKKVEAAQKPVPEELAVRKRHRALRAIARWNKRVAALVLLGYLVSVVLGVVAAQRGVLPWSWLLHAALLLAVPTVFMILVVWASGELLVVFLDMADDVRITRLLAKRQAYRKND